MLFYFSRRVKAGVKRLDRVAEGFILIYERFNAMRTVIEAILFYLNGYRGPSYCVVRFQGTVHFTVLNSEKI